MQDRLKDRILYKIDEDNWGLPCKAIALQTPSTSLAIHEGYLVTDTIEQELTFVVEEQVATITLNRPHEGNALTTTMISSLSEAWTRVAQDNDIRVAIITGSGERHFCTGASVSG